MRRRRRRALAVVSSANRETKIKHKASKNAQATQGKRGSWHNLRVHARHFHVSIDPLSVRNQLTFSSVFVLRLLVVYFLFA
jgi:hypothetical protein